MSEGSTGSVPVDKSNHPRSTSTPVPRRLPPPRFREDTAPMMHFTLVSPAPVVAGEVRVAPPASYYDGAHAESEPAAGFVLRSPVAAVVGTITAAMAAAAGDSIDAGTRSADIEGISFLRSGYEGDDEMSICAPITSPAAAAGGSIDARSADNEGISFLSSGYEGDDEMSICAPITRPGIASEMMDVTQSFSDLGVVDMTIPLARTSAKSHQHHSHHSHHSTVIFDDMSTCTTPLRRADQGKAEMARFLSNVSASTPVDEITKNVEVGDKGMVASVAVGPLSHIEMLACEPALLRMVMLHLPVCDGLWTLSSCRLVCRRFWQAVRSLEVNRYIYNGRWEL